MAEPEFSPHEERLCCVLKELVEPVVLRMVLRELKRIEADSLRQEALALQAIQCRTTT